MCVLLVSTYTHRYVSKKNFKFRRCVKTLKSLGFTPAKGTGNKISITSLTKDKVKKLSNLRVI